MVVIFDFDGTLVDSFSAAVKVLTVLAMEYELRLTVLSEPVGLRDIVAKEIMTSMQIPMYKLPFILRRAKKLMQKEMAQLKPFPGMLEVLRMLHGAGYPLGIVSSNSEQNMMAWLEQYELAAYFTFIHCSPQYFGKGRTLNTLVKKYQWDKKTTYYIGDEVRDIEAAKWCGIQSIAVTWGFNSEQLIARHQPQFVVRQPEDIVQLLKGINQF